MTSPPPVHPTPHEWSSEALLAKAQRYAEEMLSYQRDDWRFAFWSSLTLEVLARAALSGTSPTLLAENRKWEHILFALGHEPKASKYSPRSIDMTSVLARLRELHADFDAGLEGFCLSHMEARNTELHSGRTPFDGMPTANWLPAFYRACKVLLALLGQDLSSFVGPEEAKLAEQLITAAADEGAKAVMKSVAEHQSKWKAIEESEQTRLQLQAFVWARRQIGHRVDCPACGSTALVTGDPMAPPTKELHEELITETQFHLPSHFECIACGLQIAGLAQLGAAGLGEPYKATLTFDVAEYFGLEEPEFEPDFNEM